MVQGSVLAMAAHGERSITLPAEGASVGLARDFVAGAVADDVDDPAEVLLMTSELVTNVIGHVGSEVTITVCEGPLVRIEIHNHEAATAAFRDVLHHSPLPSHDAPAGRGLRLVRSLASRVGLDDDIGGGKVVWFEWDHPAENGDGDAALEVDGEPVVAS
jgi:anti-sigma regulatory factor (Ser/Thr protein kinase)